MKNSEVVGTALDVIHDRGWCKHVLENTRGEVCLLGALSAAVCGNACFDRLIAGDMSRVFWSARGVVAEVAVELFPDRKVDNIGAFESTHQVAPINNHPDTTREDVEQILEKAYVRALESE